MHAPLSPSNTLERIAAQDCFNNDNGTNAKYRQRSTNSVNKTTNAAPAPTTINVIDQLTQDESSQSATKTAAAAKRKSTSKSCGKQTLAKTKMKKKQPSKKRGRPANSKKTSSSSINAKTKAAAATANAPPAKISPTHLVYPDSATAVHMTHAQSIDEIMEESNELLRAAAEAQSFGRLAAAQSYLYLAHARLVGLGRWVEFADDGSDECIGRSGTDDGSSCEESMPIAIDVVNMATTEGSESISPDGGPSNNAHVNFSDKIAHSATELYRKHSTNALGPKKTQSNGGKKRKLQTKEKEKTNTNDKDASATKEETTPSVAIPRTVANGAHLNVRQLMVNAMNAKDSKGGRDEMMSLSNTSAQDNMNMSVATPV